MMNRPPIKEGFAYMGMLQLPLRVLPSPDPIGYKEREEAARARADEDRKMLAEQKRLERAYRRREQQLNTDLGK